MERLKALGTTMGKAHQAKLQRRQEYEKAAEAKDAELKAALAKVADLEKALPHRDRAGARERHGMLLEVQHLDEIFASKC